MTSGPSSRDPNRAQARLFGAPDPITFRDTPVGRALAASAEIHFDTREEQDRLIAIEKLALDIFEDPVAARAFVVNPSEYLRRSGFENVELDVASPEVRVAMALGDPEVKRAALNNDVDGFLDALREQGIVTEPGRQIFAVFPVEIAAVLSAVAWTWAAALHSVAAAMMVETFAALHSSIAIKTTVKGPLPVVEPMSRDEHLRMIQGVAAAAGDEEFVRAVGDRIVRELYERYADLHASVVDVLEPVLDTEEVEALRERGQLPPRRRRSID
ncbi:hypothetical protein ACI8AA_01310 [Geodermatophilus sp. SYSU D01180]